ncbi:MAG: helicase HerA domain-containing protein [Candidatus Helarchaeota archaeon]
MDKNHNFNKNFQVFDETSNNIKGRLMRIEESPTTNYKYEIWFDYTRKFYNSIKEGSFVAVKNYTLGSNNESHYSILKIVKKNVIHYAMIENLNKGYPAFSEEAAKSIRESLILQKEEPIEDLSKIIVTAIPTFKEFIFSDELINIEDFKILDETNIPIYGEEVLLLGNEASEKIINGNLSKTDPNNVIIGIIRENSDINVILDIESALKTHFGIFGFTGVGKSNLLSTFIAKMLEKSEKIKKILLFDLMDEYLGLLIDLFARKDVEAYYIFLKYNDLSHQLIESFKSEDFSDYFINTFFNQMILPKNLKNDQSLKDPFKKLLKKIFENKKIRLLVEPKTVREWINDQLDQFIKNLQIKPKINFKKEIFNNLEQFFGNDFDNLMNNDILKKLKETLQSWENIIINLTSKKSNEYISNMKNYPQQTKINLGIEYKPSFTRYFTRNAWQTAFSNFISELPERIKETASFSKFTISIDQIIDDILNDKNKKSSLYIFTTTKDTDIKSFLKKIGNLIYIKRKDEGKFEPLTTFLVDEADQFLPQKAEEDTKEAKEILETIARRGRKFGLGIGLSTQRITFLDTNILAQLHTYFISKLPRKSDRDRIKEAFSLSDEEFEATFKFSKGNWLLISHEGTGIEGIPLSIATENAENRIKDFFKNMN